MDLSIACYAHPRRSVQAVSLALKTGREHGTTLQKLSLREVPAQTHRISTRFPWMPYHTLLIPSMFACTMAFPRHLTRLLHIALGYGSAMAVLKTPFTDPTNATCGSPVLSQLPRPWHVRQTGDRSTKRLKNFVGFFQAVPCMQKSVRKL